MTKSPGLDAIMNNLPALLKGMGADATLARAVTIAVHAVLAMDSEPGRTFPGQD